MHLMHTNVHTAQTHLREVAAALLVEDAEELLKHAHDDVCELLQAHVLVVRGARGALQHAVDVVRVERRAGLLLHPVPQVRGHHAARRARPLRGARLRRRREFRVLARDAAVTAHEHLVLRLHACMPAQPRRRRWRLGGMCGAESTPGSMWPYTTVALQGCDGAGT